MGSLTDLDLRIDTYLEERKPTLPEDTYRVICTHCERKFNSKGTGELVHAEFTILEPADYAEGKLSAWFNIVHPKPFVVKKGLEALTEFAQAAGFKTIPGNTLDLVGRRLLIDTKLGKPSEQYPNPRLDIICYRPLPVEIEEDELPF